MESGVFGTIAEDGLRRALSESVFLNIDFPGLPAQNVPLFLSPGTSIFCLDLGLGLLATDSTPKAINGYAVYAVNTLYLFVTGINSLYPTQNAYIFSKSEDNYFYYVGYEAAGVLQGDGIRIGNLSPNSNLAKITDINLKYAVFQ